MADAGIVLFAHGARDRRWAEPFEKLRELLRARRPDIEIELAFLEHMTPDLATVATALAARGVRKVRIVPLFFGRGGHLRNDFPLQVTRAQAAAPAIVFEIAEAAGEDPAVIDALADFALSGLV